MISVVIPALNEERRIEQAIQSVQRQAGAHEIIVVDGGSADATREVAAPHACVVHARRGRSHQMNAGARVASGDILLFLHADSMLPDGAFAAIRAALADPAAHAGTFRLRFDAETPLLRLYSFVTQFPIPLFAFGDRGLFVRRSAFEQIGGFPAWPMYEDLELVRRLVQRGGFRFLPLAVTTAARRFQQHGTLRQQLLNTFLWLRYVLGADPHRTAHLYRYDAAQQR